jgi:hypothetical protein
LELVIEPMVALEILHWELEKLQKEQVIGQKIQGI